MNKKKKTVVRTILILFILLFISLVGGYSYYMYCVNNYGTESESIEFKVLSNDTLLSLSSSLKDKGIIKNELVYKIFIKLNNYSHIEKGIYTLDKSYSLKELLDVFESNAKNMSNPITVTIPEGKNIKELANIVSSVTTTSAEEYLEYWNSEEFINAVIEKYWFVTSEVKNKDIKYALEGYLFPSTYELLNKSVSAEYVGYRLLDQMNVILTKYKSQIESSSYSVHELLTLSSIVEGEAVLSEDRPLIASVFYNRLNKKMYLQSCATVGYLVDKDKNYNFDKYKAISDKYNTYMASSLPVGPVNGPSEASIKATLEPQTSNYLYFVGDVCNNTGKTYFATNIQGHEVNVRKYVSCK